MKRLKGVLADPAGVRLWLAKNSFFLSSSDPSPGKVGLESCHMIGLQPL